MTNFDLVLMIPTLPLLGIMLAAALRTTRLAPGTTEQAQLSDPGLAEVAATARDEAAGASGREWLYTQSGDIHGWAGTDFIEIVD